MKMSRNSEFLEVDSAASAINFMKTECVQMIVTANIKQDAERPENTQAN
jgi:hypothetical protein